VHDQRQVLADKLKSLADRKRSGVRCAQQGSPPRRPAPHHAGVILRTTPESGAVVPISMQGCHSFDEVIDEMPGARAGVGWRDHGRRRRSCCRRSGHVQRVLAPQPITSTQRGVKPNRVYHLEVLPGIADLRRNGRRRSTIVFSTGARDSGVRAQRHRAAVVEQRLYAGRDPRRPLPDPPRTSR